MSLLLADENFSHRTVEMLKNLGHDIVTLAALGLSDKALPDERVLEIAIDAKCCILTFNRIDFIKLHRKHPDHFGIIICTYNPDNKQLSEKIHSAISKQSNLFGQLIRIYRD